MERELGSKGHRGASRDGEGHCDGYGRKRLVCVHLKDEVREPQEELKACAKQHLEMDTTRIEMYMDHVEAKRGLESCLICMSKALSGIYYYYAGGLMRSRRFQAPTIPSTKA